MSELVAIATVVGTGYQIYSSEKQQKEIKKAQKEQRQAQESQLQAQQAMQGRALEAGEYFEELKAEQMELQAQSSNIRTLANLIEGTARQPAEPKIFTLPAAKTYTPVQQINMAIDKMLRG